MAIHMDFSEGCTQPAELAQTKINTDSDTQLEKRMGFWRLCLPILRESAHLQ